MEQYKEYKDSGVQWLREIPSHWGMERWKYLLEENTTKNENCAIRKQLQFKYGTIVPKANQSEENDVLDTISKYTVVRPSDIMINGLNLNYDLISQRIGMVKEIGVITSAYISLRPTAIASPRYYNYFLKAMDAHKMFHGMGTGVRMTLSYKELKNQFIPKPSLEEQNLIADYLDKTLERLDAAIAQQQQMIDLLNERKQIVINKAVTRGLDDSVALKDSGVQWLREIPSHWEAYRFKNVVKRFRKGSGITKDEVFANGNTPCVRYGEIYTKYDNSFSKCVTHTNFEKIKPARYFSYSDLLFAGTGELLEEIGKCIVYTGNEKCLAGGDVVIAEHEENPIFMAYALNADYAQKQKSYDKFKLKVVHISASNIGNVVIAVPPKDEQCQIASFLEETCSKIHSAIEQSQHQISLLQERKQIIINDAVTGKVKVV